MSAAMARSSDGRASSARVNLPSAQELAIQRNRESRRDPSIARRVASGRGGYAMTYDDAAEAAGLMDRSQVVTPLASLPASGSAFDEAAGFFGKADGSDGLWDEYYDSDQRGYDYRNLAGSVVTVNGQQYVRPGTAVTSGRAPKTKGTTDRSPAPITIPHTSTTNPERPRTVAAGYDPDREVLTVVFRDGTFYNYYTVSESDWVAFKNIQSKGQYIATFLDGKPRGTARMANASLAAREGVYRIARTGQWINDGQVSGQIDRSLPPRLNPTKSRSRKK